MKHLIPVIVLATSIAAQGPSPVKVPRPPVSEPDVKESVLLSGDRSPVPVQLPENRNMARPGRSIHPALAARGAAIASRLDDPDLVLFDQPQAGGTLWARGANFKASFAADGWTFCARPDPRALHNEPIRFHLASVQVANEPIAIADAEPERRDQRVEYRHGGVLEAIDVRGGAVEHSFTFADLPRRGELTLDLGVDTSLEIRNADTGIAFSSKSVEVTFAPAVAIDARGERVPAATSYANGRITIRVPADFVQRAQLPIVVDPLVTTVHVYTLLGLTYYLPYAPDIAWDPNTQTWGVVFELPFSADDYDVYLQRLDANLVPVGVPLPIDITYDVWQKARIADLSIYSEFMVVAQRSVDAPGPYSIVGRIYVAGSRPVMLNPFTVEAAGGNGGLSGDKLWPDVAGDASQAAPTYFTVVWERKYSSTDHDIHMRQVDSNGALRGSGPTLIDNSGYDDYWPSISKSDGPDPYTHQRFVVTWDRLTASTPPLSQTDVRAALITWDGQIVPVGGANHFYVASRTLAPTVGASFSGRPDVSTTTDGSLPGDGRRFSMITFQNDGPSGSSLVGAIVDTNGNVLVVADLSQLAGLPVYTWSPCVDCDGVRFAVGYQIPASSCSCSDAGASLFAYDSVNNQILLQETGVVLGVGGTADRLWELSVASTYSGSGLRDPRYAFTYMRWPQFSLASPIVEAASYDGLASGGIGSRPSGTGLPMSFSGSAAIGQSFQLTLTTNSVFPGVIAGLPATITVPGDPCNGAFLGVDGVIVMGNPYNLAIPPDPVFVGATFSFQGFTLTEGTCFGSIGLSDTIDVTLQ